MSDAAPALLAEAWMLGSRLDPRALSDQKPIAHGPDVYALEPGHLAIFRYGVAVYFGVPEGRQRESVESLLPSVSSPLESPEREVLEVAIDAEAREGLDPRGRLVLRTAAVERLQVVAHVLAKSTVLAHYERRVADAFRQVEARAQAGQRGLPGRRSRELLREIRSALAIQVQTVGRVEMTEKPELLWEDPGLDRLYELLAAEFELRERDAALSRKLRLISENASTSLELIHTRQGLRVEWYIVALILIEIALSLYDMVWR